LSLTQLPSPQPHDIRTVIKPTRWASAPQNKPAGFVYNAEPGTIDIVGFDMESFAKYRNVGVNPNAAVAQVRRVARPRRPLRGQARVDSVHDE